MKCRHCQTELKICFADLGFAPPSNSYLKKEDLTKPEIYFPLKAMVCSECILVQTIDTESPELYFSDQYAYFSSYSSSWLNHCETFVETIISKFQLNSNSTIVEIAANDGYLLQYVLKKEIPCYGIEPTRSTADEARKKGINIIEDFFGAALANKLVKERMQADFIIANNVLAHVPDINDFLLGVKRLLKLNGVASFEFPHLKQLMTHVQFDTIYHEHFSYLSLTSLNKICKKLELKIFKVEELSTHGGSLRIYMQTETSGQYAVESSVEKVLKDEEHMKMHMISSYTEFQDKISFIKYDLLSFLLNCKKSKLKVVGYGAAAKANTLLNYAGVHKDLLPAIIDRNPAKIGKLMPGSHIPIVDESFILKSKPDFIIIFPWNIREEITHQLNYTKKWGGKFCTFIPQLEIF